MDQRGTGSAQGEVGGGGGGGYGGYDRKSTERETRREGEVGKKEVRVERAEGEGERESGERGGRERAKTMVRRGRGR